MSAAWSLRLNSAAIAVNGDPRSATADKITAIAWRLSIFMIAFPFKVHKQVILPDILRIFGPLAYIRRIRGHFESQGRAFERLLNDKSCPIFGKKGFTEAAHPHQKVRAFYATGCRTNPARRLATLAASAGGKLAFQALASKR